VGGAAPGGECGLYVNGQPVAAVKMRMDAGAIRRTGQFTLGAMLRKKGQVVDGLRGRMDELRLWKSA
jgi:hypothetical protein